MSWQKQARIGIAVFVIAFAAVVVLAMRQRGGTPSKTPLPVRADPKSVAETRGGTHERINKEGKKTLEINSASEFVYPDGRAVMRGVTVTLPDRNGRTVTVTANELENVAKSDQPTGNVRLTGDVHLKTSDGIEVRSAEAIYDDTSGVMTVPGKVEFTRGRMTGTGVGATYDRNRDVIWLNDQAHIVVAADAKGEGAMDATAGSAGLAKADHYVRLSRNAHISAQGRIIDADDITIMLTPDDERVQMLQLRANSRITGGAAPGGPQSMSARDIDLNYGEDGRTLQRAQLMENAVVQLPGDGRGAGKRVAGRTIDITMAPDGATATSLNANENVSLDLPGEGDLPAKRIRSAALVSGGGPQGLQSATFTGNVDYRESRAAKKNVPAINRVATSLKLTVNTKPGLGALEQAEFSGNVHITDGPDVVADAPHALYLVTRDQMDLSPGDGSEPGMSPHVSDGRVSVDARTISFTLGTRKLNADTRVRSSMLPAKKAAAAPARGAAPQQPAVRVPSMLKQDEPVNVTSNRLEYEGAAGHAIYKGNARLWQGDTSVNADTIVVDDKTGNLEGQGAVRTTMLIEEADPKTGVKRPPAQTVGTSEAFLYEDAKRLATYTTKAHIVGTERDVKGDKIELFLQPDKNELQRAEAYGRVEVKETDRTATGSRLTYMAATEEYFMTGTPVVVIQKNATECKQTTASSVKFRRAIDTVDADGVGPLPLMTVKCAAGTR